MAYPHRDFYKEEELRCREDRGGCGSKFLPLDDAEIADLKQMNLTDSDVDSITDKMSNHNCPSCAFKTLFDIRVIYDRQRVDSFSNLAENVRFCTTPECRCEYSLSIDQPLLDACDLSEDTYRRVETAMVEERKCQTCALEIHAPSEIYKYLQERAEGTLSHVEAVANADQSRKEKAREERLQESAAAYARESAERSQKMHEDAEALLHSMRLHDLQKEGERADRQERKALAETQADLKADRDEKRRIEIEAQHQKEKADRDRKHQKRLRDAREEIRKGHQKRRVDADVLSKMY